MRFLARRWHHLKRYAVRMRGGHRGDTLGNRGELAAERYLVRKKYLIVGRQIRSSLGEIDLIAVDGRTVVFVEVKTRKSAESSHPAEAVGPEKQKRMTRVALAYLKRNHLLEYAARFDVIAVTWPDGQKKPAIEHFINAFEPVGRFQMFT